MTAIIKQDGRRPTPLALVGLVLPGLGHLVPGLGTAWYSILVAWTSLRVGRRRDPAARTQLHAAADAKRTWFFRHGDHGDLLLGTTLLGHLAIVGWALSAGLPRLGDVLFTGPVDEPDLHAFLAIFWMVATVVVAWYMAYRRAFPTPLTEDEQNTNGRVFVRTIKRSTNGMIGIGGALLLIGIAFVTPWIAPFDPLDTTVIGKPNLDPGWYADPESGVQAWLWLGTDSVGRDVFSRLLYGARISLSIGFVTVLIAGTIGTALGSAAGYFGGWVDTTITWVIDLLLSVPRLVLLLAILGIFSTQDLTGASKIFLIVTVLAFTAWMGVCRIVRGQILSLARQDFIQAARALGLSPLRIVARHLVPNALAPVIVYASLAVGTTILIEASLSFLGIGISPPTPTWGSMVSDGRKVLMHAPLQSTVPGLFIVWAVLSFNLLGDGLRDALDPRFRGR
jgi:peptide/nickel transport system permease protein